MFKTNKHRTLQLIILFGFFSINFGFAQTTKLDSNNMELTMRNPMEFDRAQYISQWLILGSIPAKWNEGIDRDYFETLTSEANITPEEGQSLKTSDGKEYIWKKISNPPKIINIKDLIKEAPTANTPIENLVRYAYGTINYPEAGKSILALGSDDGIKVWLNGKMVYRNMNYRRLAIDQDLVEVDLNKGINHILIKLVQTEWSNSFTARFTNDANLPENTYNKILVALYDNKDKKKLVLSTENLVNTITKQQAIEWNIYSTGGKPVFKKVTNRGDSVFLAYVNWADGPYEIQYTYNNLNGLPITEYINWFKGEPLKYAKELVESAPENKFQDPASITHRMLADFVNYRIKNNFNITDQYTISLLHPLLLEYTEMKNKCQIRPGGFIRFAYIDETDGTPQFCRCYIPRDYNPSIKTKLVVYLHGYNPDNPEYVKWWSADKRHDAYVDRYNHILIEPHGRGNTQYFDIGDRDVLKCIQMAKDYLNIDDNRIYVTGESMGGGGTWRFASVHPELFAAIAPVFGGWDYRNNISSDDLKKLTPFDHFLKDKRISTCQFESLLNLPILALHGDNDNMVSVENSRYLVRMLQRWGYNVRYIEVPGKGHENLGKNDLMYQWLFQHSRNPNPKAVKLRAADLRTASAHWLNVTQRNFSWKMINAEAEILINNIIRVNTENVLEIKLTPDRMHFDDNKPLHIIWNGEITTINKYNGESIILNSAEYKKQKLHKTPEITGPLNDFTNTPFAIVIGTISEDSLMCKLIKMKAENFKSYWVSWQKFEPRIFRDTEIKDTDLKKYSVFLIGGPKENLISKKLSKSLPFEATTKSISICGKVFDATNSVLDAIFPNPLNAERYIRLAIPTSSDGMFMYHPVNFNLLNYDYVISNSNKTNIITGFFDYNWMPDTTFSNDLK